jgi:hypothetical protein
MKNGEITPQQNGQKLKILKRECCDDMELSLLNLFNTEEKVLANWYTGEIVISSLWSFRNYKLGFEKVTFSICEGIVIDVKYT